MDIKRFVAGLRARAAELRRYTPEVANVLEDVASDLEAQQRDHEVEALPLARAAEESGYTASHLGRLIAEGKLLNAGQKHAPRILRRDLPRKPPRTARRTGQGAPDLAGEVLRNRGLVTPTQ